MNVYIENEGWLEVTVRGSRTTDIEPPTHSGGGSWETITLGRVVADHRRNPLRPGTVVYVRDYAYGTTVRQTSIHVVLRRNKLPEESRRMRRRIRSLYGASVAKF